MTENVLALWTIYENPRDYPDKFVARKFLLDKPTDELIIAATLEELRAVLRDQYGLYPLAREPADDPVIVETWL